MSPLLILLLGTLVVILCIVRLRIGAFFGLMLAAFLVSFLAPGAFGDKLPRVVAALGAAAGKLAIIITCAEIFPAEVRATGMSLVYALGVAIFGGFAPFI